MTKLRETDIVKERWFNYRPICLVCVFLLLGSVFSYYITNNLALTLTVSIMCFVLLLAIAILKGHIKYFLVPLLAFVVGIGAYNFAVSSFEKEINYIPTTIQARINYVGRANATSIQVQADSCVFDGKKVNDNIILYISDNSGEYKNIQEGGVIKFSPNRFYHTAVLYKNIPNSSAISKNNKYTVSALIENVEYIKTDKTLSENIKDSIKSQLTNGLNNENLNLAYSALFGDKSEIDLDQYNAMRASGVAHLLAVSGLHVGIIVSILYFIMKIFRANDITKLCVVSLFLLLYMYICGFSVSVVRASVMAILLLFSKVIHARYDSYNALAIGAIIIYIFNPLCVFDISFLMSFGCGIGIAMLYKPIKQIIDKTHIPDQISGSISISLSTTITLMFIMAFFFKTLNIISILSNVIIIPLFTLAFVPVFVLSFLSFVPYITYLAYPINYLFKFIVIIANAFADIPFSSFATMSLNYISIVVYFLTILFLGRLCSAKYKYKIAATVPIVALLIICLI